jgi:GGDEF domain-containing protein
MTASMRDDSEAALFQELEAEFGQGAQQVPATQPLPDADEVALFAELKSEFMPTRERILDLPEQQKGSGGLSISAPREPKLTTLNDIWGYLTGEPEAMDSPVDAILNASGKDRSAIFDKMNEDDQRKVEAHLDEQDRIRLKHEKPSAETMQEYQSTIESKEDIDFWKKQMSEASTEEERLGIGLSIRGALAQKTSDYKTALKDQKEMARQAVKDGEITQEIADRLSDNAGLRMLEVGITQSAGNLTSLALRPAELVGIEVSDTISERVGRVSAANTLKNLQDFTDENAWVADASAGSISSMIEMIPGAAIGGAKRVQDATKLAKYAPAVFGGVNATNQAISTGRQAGLEGADLAAYALTQGGIETMMETLPMMKGVGAEAAAMREAASRGLVGTLRTVMADTAGEVSSEMMTTILNQVADFSHGVNKDALTPETLEKELKSTMVSSLIMSGGMSGARGTIDLAAGQKVSREAIESNKELADWAEKNPEAAAEIAAKKSPSRKDFLGAGLPKVDSAERKAIAKQLKSDLEARRAPEAAPEVVGVPEEAKAPPTEPQPAQIEDLTPQERQRFVSEEEIGLKELKKAGLSEQQLELARKYGAFGKDAVTGWNEGRAGEARINTGMRLVDHANETGEAAAYGVMDLKNLGGLNKVLGDEGANKVYRAISDIMGEEIQKAGGDTHKFRHGGDELSVFAANLDQKDLTSALESAQERIEKYAKDNNLHEITHPKHPSDLTKRGTGISFAVEAIEQGLDRGDIQNVIALAGQRLESAKEITGYEQRIEAERVRGLPPTPRRAAERTGPADIGKQVVPEKEARKVAPKPEAKPAERQEVDEGVAAWFKRKMDTGAVGGALGDLKSISKAGKAALDFLKAGNIAGAMDSFKGMSIKALKPFGKLVGVDTKKTLSKTKLLKRIDAALKKRVPTKKVKQAVRETTGVKKPKAEKIETTQKQQYQLLQKATTKAWTESKKALQKLKSDLTKYARENLPAGVREKVMGAIDRAKTEAGFKKAIEKIDFVAAETAVKEAVSKVKKSIKKANKFTAGGTQFKEMHPQFRDAMQQLLGDVDVKKRSKAIKDVVAYLKSDEIKQDANEELLSYVEQGIELVGKKNLNDMTLEELGQLDNAINSILKEQEGLASQIHEEHLGKRAAVKEEILETVGRPEADLEGREAKDAGVFRKIWNRIGENVESMSMLLDQKDDGIAQRFFSDQLHTARAKMSKLRGDMWDAFKGRIGDLEIPSTWSNKLAGKNEMESFTLESGQNIQVTKAQKIYIHLLGQDAEGRQALLTSNGFVIGKPKKTGLARVSRTFRETDVIYEQPMTEADLKQIDDSMSPEEKKVADAIQETMNNEAKDIFNEASMERFGFEMATKENYMKIMRYSKDIKKSSAEQLKAQVQKGDPIENAGFLKDRTKSKAKLIIPDVFQVLGNHINETAAMNAYMVRMRNIQSILNDSEVRASIESKYGEDTYNTFKTLVDRVRGTAIKNPDEAIWTKLRQNFAISTLALRPSTWIAQTLSYPDAGHEVGYANLAKAAALKTISPEADKAVKSIIDNSEMLTARFSQGLFDRDLASLSSAGELENELTGKTGIRDKLGYFIQKFDQGTVKRVILAAHLKVKQDGGSAQDAIDLAEKAVRRTQPTFSQETRTRLGGSKSELVRSLTMFRSYRDKALINLSIQARKEGVKSKQFAGALGQIVVINALTNAMRLALYDAVRGKDDEEEFSKKLSDKAISNVPGLIPFAGDIARKLTSKFKTDAVGSPVFDLINESVEATQEIGRAFIQFMKDERYDKSGRGFRKGDPKSTKSLERGLKKAVGGTRLTGAPLEGVVKLYKDLNDIYSNYAGPGGDPRESGIQKAYKLRQSFLKALDKPKPRFTTYATAGMRQAAVADDYEAFKTAADRYKKDSKPGKAVKGFKSMLRYLDPMKGRLTKQQEADFQKSLTDEQKENWVESRAFSKELSDRLAKWWKDYHKK